MNGPTTDHSEIRQWAESRGATPVEVFPRVFDSEPAILRFVFGTSAQMEPELRTMEWESFFATFDLLGLSFVYEGDRRYELLQIEEKSVYRFDGKPV